MQDSIIIISIVLSFMLLSCSNPKEQQIPKKQPNILLIMTDDQGWFDAGFNGNTKIKTPNMDLLASNGIIFDRFYAASAVCSPTRKRNYRCILPKL